MNEFGVRLQKALNERGVKQKELANTIGIAPPTVSQLCMGVRNPSPRTIRDICAALNIREEWLRTGEEPMDAETPESIVRELAERYNLTPAVVALLEAVSQAFEALPEEKAVQIVGRLTEALAASGGAPKEEAAVVPLPTPRRTLRRYDSPAAAGAPLWAESDYTEVEYPAAVVPDEAAFAVILAGHSMEPGLANGETVFVQRTQQPRNGDVVIAWISGEGTVCKRAQVVGGRLIMLSSDNPAFPSIAGHALEGARIYGRVVGHTATTDRPAPIVPPAPTTAPELPDRLRRARLALEWSHRDVANALNAITGGEAATEALVKAWEQGKKPVPAAFRAALEQALKL